MRTHLITRLRTTLGLGLVNVLRVAEHRVRLRAGVHPAQKLAATDNPKGPFFRVQPSTHTTVADADAVDRTYPAHFGWFDSVGDGAPPNWHFNPFTGVEAPYAQTAWWRIPDFDPGIGDIKAIWEQSRFDWVVFLAESGFTDEDKVAVLNRWLADWCERNPPYLGPNWKCGQEASIRVIHLALASILRAPGTRPEPGLLTLVRNHLARIAPGLSYAIGQDNNHGTSEAAALFIGGTWLESAGDSVGRKWSSTGRRWLEERVHHLVQPDGTFSQYSTNYHRLLLDTLGVVEIWRRLFGQPAFSQDFNIRASEAARWLWAITDSRSGDVPNIGGNDGANLLRTSDTSYRDFRPSVRLGMGLFCDQSCFDAPEQGVDWLRIGLVPGKLPPAPSPTSRRCDDGGFAILRRRDAMVVVRYPRYRFRPSDADALHLDFWYRGENHLRDAGTYSYADREWRDYFAGVQGHNTVQFDGRDQMPRLGRFLWGDWLKTLERSPIEDGGQATTFSAAYQDSHGARHERRVTLADRELSIEDTVSGFQERAVLRWRLSPGAWTMAGQTALSHHGTMMLSANAAIKRCELVQGFESRYYLQRTPCPVMELEVCEPATIVSVYSFTE